MNTSEETPETPELSGYDFYEVHVPIVRVAKALVIAKSPEQARAYLECELRDGSAVAELDLRVGETIDYGGFVPAASRMGFTLEGIIPREAMVRCRVLGYTIEGRKAHEIPDEEADALRKRVTASLRKNVELRMKLQGLALMLNEYIERDGERLLAESSEKGLGDTYVGLETLISVSEKIVTPLLNDSKAVVTASSLGAMKDVTARTELMRTLPGLLEEDTRELTSAVEAAQGLIARFVALAN